MSDKWGNLALRRALKAANVDDDLADEAAASIVLPETLAERQQATDKRLAIYIAVIGLLISAGIGSQVLVLREVSEMKADIAVLKELAQQRP